MDDVFAVQDDIARGVTSQLKVTLLGDEPLINQPTENLVAYHAYLRGSHHWQMQTKEGLTRALTYFTEALRAEPDYAQALATD